MLKICSDAEQIENYMRQFLNSLPQELASLKIIMLDKGLHTMSWDKFASLVLVYGRQLNLKKDTTKREEPDGRNAIASFGALSSTVKPVKFRCHYCGIIGLKISECWKLLNGVQMEKPI